MKVLARSLARSRKLCALIVACALLLFLPQSRACPPTGLVGAPLETAVRLFWQHPPEDGVVTFNIYRSTLSAPTFVRIASTTEHTYLDPNLPAQRFDYYVTASHDDPPFEFFQSNLVSVTPKDDPPPPLETVTIRFSGNLYQLQWAYPNPPVDLAGFWIEQRHTPVEPWQHVNAKLRPPDARSFVGPKPRNRIYLRVSAVDRTGHVTPSPQILTAEPGDFAKHPLHSHHQPQSLTGTGGETIAQLTWTQPEGTSLVYRSATSGAGYELIAETSSYNFTDTGVPAGVWWYRVSGIAHDPPEESEPSSEVSVTVTDDPPPPAQDFFLQLGAEIYTLQGVVPNPPPDLAGVKILRSWTSGSGYVPATESLVPVSNGGFLFQDRLPRATLYLRVVTVDNTGHETLAAQELVVDPRRLVQQEPRRNPTYLGGASSVTPTGEFVWRGG